MQQLVGSSLKRILARAFDLEVFRLGSLATAWISRLSVQSNTGHQSMQIAILEHFAGASGLRTNVADKLLSCIENEVALWLPCSWDSKVP